MRHVASEAGVKRYHLPIGTPLGQSHDKHELVKALIHAAVADTSYRGQHQGPAEDYGSRGDDIEEMMPGFYENPRNYDFSGGPGQDDGGYYQATQESIAKVLQWHNHPGKVTTVYRAVPKTVKSNKLNPGDWVSPSRTYAKMHGENNLGEGVPYKIIKQIVVAGSMRFDGNDINEWSWWPNEVGLSSSGEVIDLVKHVATEKGVKYYHAPIGTPIVAKKVNGKIKLVADLNAPKVPLTPEEKLASVKAAYNKSAGLPSTKAKIDYKELLKGSPGGDKFPAEKVKLKAPEDKHLAPEPKTAPEPPKIGKTDAEYQAIIDKAQARLDEDGTGIKLKATPETLRWWDSFSTNSPAEKSLLPENVAGTWKQAHNWAEPPFGKQRVYSPYTDEMWAIALGEAPKRESVDYQAVWDGAKAHIGQNQWIALGGKYGGGNTPGPTSWPNVVEIDADYRAVAKASPFYDYSDPRLAKQTPEWWNEQVLSKIPWGNRPYVKDAYPLADGNTVYVTSEDIIKATHTPEFKAWSPDNNPNYNSWVLGDPHYGIPRPFNAYWNRDSQDLAYAMKLGQGEAPSIEERLKGKLPTDPAYFPTIDSDKAKAIVDEVKANPSVLSGDPPKITPFDYLVATECLDPWNHPTEGLAASVVTKAARGEAVPASKLAKSAKLLQSIGDSTAPGGGEPPALTPAEAERELELYRSGVPTSPYRLSFAVMAKSKKAQFAKLVQNAKAKFVEDTEKLEKTQKCTWVDREPAFQVKYDESIKAYEEACAVARGKDAGVYESTPVSKFWNSYMSSKYRDYNSSLRNGNRKYLDIAARMFDEYGYTTDKPVKSWRGFRQSKDFDLTPALNGDGIFVDNGIQSTTSQKSYAFSWVSEANDHNVYPDRFKYIGELTIPPGTRLVGSRAQGESEIMLPPGTIYQITGIEDTDQAGVKLVKMDVIPPTDIVADFDPNHPQILEKVKEFATPASIAKMPVNTDIDTVVQRVMSFADLTDDGKKGKAFQQNVETALALKEFLPGWLEKQHKKAVEVGEINDQLGGGSDNVQDDADLLLYGQDGMRLWKLQELTGVDFGAKPPKDRLFSVMTSPGAWLQNDGVRGNDDLARAKWRQFFEDAANQSTDTLLRRFNQLNDFYKGDWVGKLAPIAQGGEGSKGIYTSTDNPLWKMLEEIPNVDQYTNVPGLYYHGQKPTTADYVKRLSAGMPSGFTGAGQVARWLNANKNLPYLQDATSDKDPELNKAIHDMIAQRLTDGFRYETRGTQEFKDTPEWWLAHNYDSVSSAYITEDQLKPLRALGFKVVLPSEDPWHYVRSNPTPWADASYDPELVNRLMQVLPSTDYSGNEDLQRAIRVLMFRKGFDTLAPQEQEVWKKDLARYFFGSNPATRVGTVLGAGNGSDFQSATPENPSLVLLDVDNGKPDWQDQLDFITKNYPRVRLVKAQDIFGSVIDKENSSGTSSTYNPSTTYNLVQGLVRARLQGGNDPLDFVGGIDPAKIKPESRKLIAQIAGLRSTGDDAIPVNGVVDRGTLANFLKWRMIAQGYDVISDDDVAEKMRAFQFSIRDWGDSRVAIFRKNDRAQTMLSPQEIVDLIPEGSQLVGDLDYQRNVGRGEGQNLTGYIDNWVGLYNDWINGGMTPDVPDLNNVDSKGIAKLFYMFSRTGYSKSSGTISAKLINAAESHGNKDLADMIRDWNELGMVPNMYQLEDLHLSNESEDVELAGKLDATFGPKYRAKHAPSDEDLVRLIANALKAKSSKHRVQLAFTGTHVSPEAAAAAFVLCGRGTVARPNARLKGSKSTRAIKKVRDTELLYRANYLLNAARRIQESIDEGMTVRQATRKESGNWQAHEKARRGRLDSVREAERQAQFYGDLLGWYLNPFLNNDRECIVANGNNFYASKGTIIGYPGSVHPNCGCTAGPPHPGGKLVNAALVSSGVLRDHHRPLLLDTVG